MAGIFQRLGSAFVWFLQDFACAKDASGGIVHYSIWDLNSSASNYISIFPKLMEL